MPNPPRRPNPVELRRQADELHERSSALPDPPRQKLGIGKLAVPPPRPELRSAPVHEDTRQGVAPMAPRSAPEPPRSMSPPPREEAGDPLSAHAARLQARQRVAEQEARERVAASVPVSATVLDSVKIEFPRAGLGAIGKAILGAIAAALVGGGGAVVGSQTAANQMPTVQAVPCQQRCPKGNRQEIPPGLAAGELQATMQCCEVMQARLEAEEALVEAKAARDLAGKASDKATKAETNTVKVNP